MIITVTLNPAIDKTSYIDKLNVNSLNRLNKINTDIGGKGINVSKILKQLNEESICLGFIGGFTGNLIKSKLDELNIKHNFTQVVDNTRTNLKIIDKDYKLTEISEPGPIITLMDIQDLKDKLNNILNKNDILILSGSASPSINTNIYLELSNLAHIKHCTTILDADGDLLVNGLKGCINVLKPNKYELCKYLNRNEDISNEELIEQSKTLLNANLNLIVLSLGEEGSYFISKEEIYKVEPIKTSIVTTVGAGDAMVSGIAYGLSNNYSLTEIIKLSSACASASISKKLGTPINVRSIEKLKDKVIFYKL